MSAKVGLCREFSPDELDGFEQCVIPLPREDDGELCATLVRTVRGIPDERPGVLYLHGFVDYFFQVELARAVEEAGYRFYALDLRRYGRSLRPSNRANWARSIDDYFPELEAALSTIAESHGRAAGIIAHSTGGLVACHYLASQVPPLPVDCLVLNSPFLRFSFGWLDQAKLWFVVRMSKYFPSVLIPEKMSGVYGKTLHKSYGGEWDYDLKKKPIEGFPLYSGWFGMIVRAQRMIPGLRLDLPVLCLHGDRSRRPSKEVTEEDAVSEIILDVEDMKTLAPTLGPQVTLVEIAGGVHDLLLSRKPARDRALQAMVSFVKEHALAT